MLFRSISERFAAISAEVANKEPDTTLDAAAPAIPLNAVTQTARTDDEYVLLRGRSKNRRSAQ